MESNKIYVIWNHSGPVDGDEGKIIEYISNNKKDAIAYFHKHYDDVPTRPNDKWWYMFVLIEYPNGWVWEFGSQNNGEYSILINVDNFTKK